MVSALRFTAMLIHATAAWFALNVTALGAATTAPPETLGAKPADATVITAMAGTWDVTQRMWTGTGAKPTSMPAAVARRTVAAGGGFIDEVMTLADPATGDPFTRTAHLNYNAVDRAYEYFSVDSRAPQQMHYTTRPAAPSYVGPFCVRRG